LGDYRIGGNKVVKPLTTFIFVWQGWSYDNISVEKVLGEQTRPE